jgi:hypothetical protein
LYKESDGGNFTADFMMLKEGLLQEVIMKRWIKISETKRELLTEVKPGISWQKIKGLICFLCTIYSNSNGKSLVSVGIRLYYSYDSGNTWKQLAWSEFVYNSVFDNHTAIAAGKNNDRIHFLNKTLFYNKMHGIGL